jgi:putative transposase
MKQANSLEDAKGKDAPVKETKLISLSERVQDETKSYLEKLLSDGARRLLQVAIDNEVTEYLETHRDQRTETGERAIVRNGHFPEQELVTGIGPIKIQ